MDKDKMIETQHKLFKALVMANEVMGMITAITGLSMASYAIFSFGAAYFIMNFATGYRYQQIYDKKMKEAKQNVNMD